MYDHRCDERLKDEDEGSTRLTHTSYDPSTVIRFRFFVYYEGIK